MSNQQFSLRKFFELIANAILPNPGWPESELPLIRHQPLADDDEVQWWGDWRYIEALADEIEDRCTVEGLQLPNFPPIEGQRFWAGFGDWPDDVAAQMLADWRALIDGTAVAA